MKLWAFSDSLWDLCPLPVLSSDKSQFMPNFWSLFVVTRKNK